MSLLLRTDITAVYLSSRYIYCGIGNRLHIYNGQPPHGIVSLLQVLEQGVKIHGVVGGEGEELVVWGEGQVCVLRQGRGQGQSQVDGPGPGAQVRVRGWVLAAALAGARLALLTAHNHLLVLEASGVGGAWREAWRVQEWEGAEGAGAARCARLAPLRGGGLLVAGGTAHAALLLTYLPPQTAPAGPPPLPHRTQRLLGHQGVLLAVELSVPARLVASASDDRSVRLWRPAAGPVSPAAWDGPWTCVAELRAHTARPLALALALALAPDAALAPARLYSAGEDATLCAWQLAGGANAGMGGGLVCARSLQPGAELWAVSAIAGAVLTGGGDAALLLHSAPGPALAPAPLPAPAPAMPKLLAYTHGGLLLALGELPQLLVLEGGRWRALPLQHASTYKMLAVSACRQLAVAAAGCGRLDVWAEVRAGGLVHVAGARLPEPLLALAWAGTRRLVASAPAGALLVLGLHEGALQVVARLQLPRAGGRLAAAALHERTDTLLVADRAGDLHAYRPPQEAPACTLKKIHGHYGPTSMSVLDDVVATTGRDGCVRHFLVEAGATVRRLHRIDVPFAWLEGFVDKERRLACGFQERELVLYDVRGSCVVARVPCGGGHRAWAARVHFHRLDDHFRKHVTLVFMKNSQLNVTTVCLDDVLPSIIIPGIHAREINSLIRLDVGAGAEGGEHYLVSAGEDTTLRVSRTDARTYIVDEYVLRHLSSVRAVDAIKFGDDEVVIACGGGRGQVCTRVAQVRRGEGGGARLLLLEGAEARAGTGGASCARGAPRPWREGAVHSEPDIRVMDVKLHARADASLRLFAGCSDGLIRVFAVDRGDVGSLRAVGALRHHATCVLKLSVVQLHGRAVLVSASTLGELAFWDIDHGNISSTPADTARDSEASKETSDQEIVLDVTPMFLTHTNKSGINSVSALVLGGTQVALATGGDDNAIHVLLLRAESAGGGAGAGHTLREAWRLSEAAWHSGQVTGLQLVGGGAGDAGDALLLSVGVDQCVSLGALELGAGAGRLRLLRRVRVHVADAHGLQLLARTQAGVCVCVYGKGVETLQLAP